MKLATLQDGSTDGRLMVVSRDLTRAVEATDIALQELLSPIVARLAHEVNETF